MSNLKEKLKMQIKDQTAAFIILGTYAVILAASIGIFSLIKYNQSFAVNANMENTSTQEEIMDMNSLSKVGDANNIEELKKQNEKELEEAKKKEEKEGKKKKADSSPSYYIKVNYGAQVVTVYTKDSNGKYTKPVKAMVCSTGVHTPTSGVYKTSNKWTWLKMIGDVYGHYVTQIVGDILFHSVPYLETDNSTLEYWAYDQLGTRASLGCVRLTTKDALWIYNNCKWGTQVEFYSSSNPGPLGKPSARKISSAPAKIRGWDPTDPDPRNPWDDYLKEKAKKEKEKNKDNNKDKNDSTKPSKPSKPTKPNKPNETTKPSDATKPGDSEGDKKPGGNSGSGDKPSKGDKEEPEVPEVNEEEPPVVNIIEEPEINVI